MNGNPPESYVTGTEYTKEEIDKALALEETEGRRLVPSRDFSGHGTAVLGIAAGNGRASGGVNRGVAYESELLVVKMGNARENSFSKDNGTDGRDRLSCPTGSADGEADCYQYQFWK